MNIFVITAFVVMATLYSTYAGSRDYMHLAPCRSTRKPDEDTLCNNACKNRPNYDQGAFQNNTEIRDCECKKLEANCGMADMCEDASKPYKCTCWKNGDTCFTAKLEKRLMREILTELDENINYGLPRSG